jgi:hypothetical protein
MLASALIFVIMASCILFVPNFVNAQSTYKVSGYILDSSGKGVAGAKFTLYPAGQVTTDNSGYYQINASGSQYYSIFVWPPFDSNYLAYTERGFYVGTTDATKNITLTSGVKLCGYIKADSSTPISGALGFLGDYYSGWYSNSSGYYFITAPAGTYTLKFEPKTGPTFPTFVQFNFSLTQNTFKNVTLNDPENTPIYDVSGYVLDSNGKGISGAEIVFGVTYVTSVISGSTGYYSIFAPLGTYHAVIWPPFDSNYLSYNQPSLTVGSTDITQNFTLSVGCKVSGYLTDSAGNPIRGAIASLGTHTSGWYSNDSGYYFTTAPIGVYNLKIQPRTGPDFPIYTEANFNLSGDVSRSFILAASQSTSTPPDDRKIFEVLSNSTVSELSFNSNGKSLNFKVSGPSGTTGYTRAIIAKSLMPNFSGTSVSMDGKNMTFTLVSTSDYWILEFNYSHSTHQVVVGLADIVTTATTATPTQTNTSTSTSTIPEFTLATAAVGILLISVFLALARKKLVLPNRTVK